MDKQGTAMTQTHIPQRTVRATFNALRKTLDRANAAIDKAERADPSSEFLSPEDEQFRNMAAEIACVMDTYWHLLDKPQGE